MEIIKEINGNQLVVKLNGELNSFTASSFEEVIKNDLSEIKLLIIVLENLVYLSSAGLRVLLVGHKIMSKQGKMILKHVNESVKEIFEITGFLNILEIEN